MALIRPEQRIRAVAQANREFVAEQLAAAVGEDRRVAGLVFWTHHKACGAKLGFGFGTNENSLKTEEIRGYIFGETEILDES